MEILKFENTECTVDPSFLKVDEYTFSVLIRILHKSCTKAVTDGERFMIFYSKEPYPVWIWTPDDIELSEMEKVYLLARDEFGIENNQFNMKHSLSDFFIPRARKDGYYVGVDMDMLAYSCSEAVPPTKDVPGFVEEAKGEDLAEAAEMFRSFYHESGIDDVDDICLEKAQSLIAKHALFFWNDGDGRVACCGYNESADQCSINSVYTRPCARRRGYASALVYYVANHILKLGMTPTLYTDADYSASNACYTAIGFTVKGGLCAVG